MAAAVAVPNGWWGGTRNTTDGLGPNGGGGGQVTQVRVGGVAGLLALLLPVAERRWRWRSWRKSGGPGGGCGRKMGRRQGMGRTAQAALAVSTAAVPVPGILLTQEEWRQWR